MNFIRALSCGVAGVALIVACGSEDSSTFDPASIDAGNASSSSSGFIGADTGAIPIPDAGGNTNCKPLTCAEQGIECGPAGDGCGNLIPDCGKCATGLRCGGPGSPSKCVSPNVGTACTPKTCKDLDINCGPAGDGCGGLIPSCGVCGSGEQCGNDTTPSKCVVAAPTGPDGGACVPRDCSFYTALGMNCGEQSDGCGGSILCGTCTVQGEFCGGGGPNVCGNPTTCVKKTCASYPGACGPQSDDCGGVTENCGNCQLPEICGGGGVPSKCGGGTLTGPDGGACVPRSTCGANECGDVADGCGGVLSCGTSKCTGATICGGAGTPNQCGAPACAKNPATQAAACAGKNCGVVADGCGGTWVCGPATCGDGGAICGGGGQANVCGGGTVTGPDGGTCTPRTSASCAANQCGPFADGCGGLYTCPNCTTGECGGAGQAGVCGGGNQCTPIPRATACAGMTCGFAPDGCGPGSVNGGKYACGNLNGACPTDQVCGLGGPNVCGSLSGACISNTTTPCTSNQMCCSGVCGALGFCLLSLPDGGTPSCTNVGGACTAGNQCCSGRCFGNTCVAQASCLATGATCTADSQCCSKGCMGGKCSAATSFCKQNNDTCTNDAQCCSGNCTGNTASQAGICSDITGIGGGVSCMVAGTVTDGSCGAATQADPYVCNSACCSGSCGFNDSASGHTICQQPSACAPQGELCQQDSDCCQGAGLGITWKGTPLTCSKTVATDKFGRCNNATSCSKPGEICKTAVDSCSFNNNCCEPPDIPSGNCNSNPAACCRHDLLGIPRCVAFSVCRTAGQSCETSADCCNALPCTDHDNDPSTPTVCAATQCIADEGACSVDADCCGGNCYREAPGDTTGVCRVPTCEKRTCDYYNQTGQKCGPNKDQPCCGQLSDGCGDVTALCGTCTLPQTCGGGGVPNVCGGTVCTPKTACDAGMECGDIPDGCGGTIHCGDCTLPETCGGGGQAYVCGTPSCTARTCEDQGIQCGQTGNGCGQVIDCPPCPTGTTCGGGGVANQCGAPACTPKACPAGLNCGQYPNGCGGAAECGVCPEGETCGGGGTANVCGKATCTAKSCAQQYPTGIKNCGTISDLCGSVVSCGTCPQGQTCVDNECIGSACVPKTCAQLGVQCGQVANGCGGLTADCGPCPPGQGCGAGGTPNVCGTQPCTPKTCADLGATCGQVADGCGGLTQPCGDCGGNLACKNGACVQACTPRTCTEAAAQCGFIADGCGGVVDCGICQDGYTCGHNGQPNKCGRDQPN